LQSELAHDIAEALHVKLKPTAASAAVRHKNAEAYKLYLKGRYSLFRQGPNWLDDPIEYFQQAIALDPTYALAYSGLADAYLVSSTRSQLSREQALPLAMVNATKAIALDSTLAETWTSLARARQIYEWDWKGADEAYARAIKINARYALAYSYRGLLRARILGATGQADAGVRDTRTALELDSLNPIFNHYHGIALWDARHYDDAITYHSRALELAEQSFASAHLQMGHAHIAKGDYDAALAEYEEAYRVSAAGSKSAGADRVHPRAHRPARRGARDPRGDSK
jgi:tetratricopeptide (TPR) repeat protein